MNKIALVKLLESPEADLFYKSVGIFLSLSLHLSQSPSTINYIDLERTEINPECPWNLSLKFRIQDTPSQEPPYAMDVLYTFIKMYAQMIPTEASNSKAEISRLLSYLFAEHFDYNWEDNICKEDDLSFTIRLLNNIFCRARATRNTPLAAVETADTLLREKNWPALMVSLLDNKENLREHSETLQREALNLLILTGNGGLEFSSGDFTYRPHRFRLTDEEEAESDIEENNEEDSETQHHYKKTNRLKGNMVDVFSSRDRSLVIKKMALYYSTIELIQKSFNYIFHCTRLYDESAKKIVLSRTRVAFLIAQHPGLELNKLPYVNGEKRDLNLATIVIINLVKLILSFNQNDLVHRDFKEDNVIVSPEGEVYPIDFELAARIGDLTIRLFANDKKGAPCYDNHYSIQIPNWDLVRTEEQKIIPVVISSSINQYQLLRLLLTSFFQKMSYFQLFLLFSDVYGRLPTPITASDEKEKIFLDNLNLNTLIHRLKTFQQHQKPNFQPDEENTSEKIVSIALQFQVQDYINWHCTLLELPPEDILVVLKALPHSQKAFYHLVNGGIAHLKVIQPNQIKQNKINPISVLYFLDCALLALSSTEEVLSLLERHRDDLLVTLICYPEAFPQLIHAFQDALERFHFESFCYEDYITLNEYLQSSPSLSSLLGLILSVAFDLSRSKEKRPLISLEHFRVCQDNPWKKPTAGIQVNTLYDPCQTLLLFIHQLNEKAEGTPAKSHTALIKKYLMDSRISKVAPLFKVDINLLVQLITKVFRQSLTNPREKILYFDENNILSLLAIGDFDAALLASTSMSSPIHPYYGRAIEHHSPEHSALMKAPIDTLAMYSENHIRYKPHGFDEGEESEIEEMNRDERRTYRNQGALSPHTHLFSTADQKHHFITRERTQRQDKGQDIGKSIEISRTFEPNSAHIPLGAGLTLFITRAKLDENWDNFFSKPRDFNTVVFWFEQLVFSVMRLTQQNIIHGNLNGNKILIRPEQEVIQIVDFSLSHYHESRTQAELGSAVSATTRLDSTEEDENYNQLLTLLINTLLKNPSLSNCHNASLLLARLYETESSRIQSYDNLFEIINSALEEKEGLDASAASQSI